jgi:hypothetical protein
MAAIPINRRDPVVQERLNEHLRRPEVLQYLLRQALHADPASPEQVRQFLTTAPPEVFVALDSLLPLPQGSCDEHVEEDRIAQGFVGMMLAAGGRR